MSSWPEWLVDLIVVLLRWIVEHMQQIGEALTGLVGLQEA